jgi:hypothetical protein
MKGLCGIFCVELCHARDFIFYTAKTSFLEAAASWMKGLYGAFCIKCAVPFKHVIGTFLLLYYTETSNQQMYSWMEQEM